MPKLGTYPLVTVTQGHYVCEPKISVHGSGAGVLRPSYHLRIKGCRTASVLWYRRSVITNITCRKAGCIQSKLARQHGAAPTQGAQAQPTDIAQQFTQMMQAPTGTRAESTATSNGRGIHTRTAIARNIATSVEVRDRSELNGIPKPDKFSGQPGTWDSRYFKSKTWIETSRKNAGRCVQLLEERQDTEINETSLEDDDPGGAELVAAQARQALISLCEGEPLRLSRIPQEVSALA